MSKSRNLPCRVTPSIHPAGQRGDRRVVGLQAAERGDVDPYDGTAGEAPGQVVDQRLDLGKLRHAATVLR
jgi:hypothetical protein